MSKYIDLGKVKEMVFNADISMAETEALYKSLDNLPTIEVSEDCISREQVRTKLDYISYAEKDPITIAKRIVDNAPSVVPKVPSDDNKAYTYCSRCGMRVVVETPSVVPTTEQSSKVGEWVDSDGNPCNHQFSLYCSNCKAWSEYRGRFCHNCGCKMEGE